MVVKKGQSRLAYGPCEKGSKGREEKAIRM